MEVAQRLHPGSKINPSGCPVELGVAAMPCFAPYGDFLSLIKNNSIDYSMEDLTFTNDCAKAVVLAAQRIGINPTAFVCALREGAIASLIECAMRVEDATVIGSDGRLVPGLTFHEAVTLLSKALDALTDISMSSSAQ